MTVVELREQILDFAKANPNIRAVIETGAFARAEPPADEFSDLDIELYARDPELLRDKNSWFEAFGPIWVFLALDNDGYNPTRLVIYAGGAKVDFSLYDVARLEQKLPSQAQERGFIVHLDKDELLNGWSAPPPELATRPDLGPWEECRADFWFESYNLAKYLARGDLWHAKIREAEVKEYLLQMLEWYAGATSGADVQYLGHFLESWVDEETWGETQCLWAGFGVAENFRALGAMMDLYTRISQEVAATWGLPLEGVDETGIRDFVAKTRKKWEIAPNKPIRA